jgi:hypothetical protein
MWSTRCYGGVVWMPGLPHRPYVCLFFIFFSAKNYFTKRNNLKKVHKNNGPCALCSFPSSHTHARLSSPQAGKLVLLAKMAVRALVSVGLRPGHVSVMRAMSSTASRSLSVTAGRAPLALFSPSVFSSRDARQHATFLTPTRKKGTAAYQVSAPHVLSYPSHLCRWPILHASSFALVVAVLATSETLSRQTRPHPCEPQPCTVLTCFAPCVGEPCKGEVRGCHTSTSGRVGTAPVVHACSYYFTFLFLAWLSWVPSDHVGGW